MGGGNAQKSAKARQMKQEKMKTASKGARPPPRAAPEIFPRSPARPPPLINSPRSDPSADSSATHHSSIPNATGSQLADNAKAMNIQCKVCLQTFVSTTASVKLKEHADNKHPKNPYEQCFPNNPL